MNLSKYIVSLILLAPVAINAQTVHIGEERILYKGAVKLKEGGKDVVFDKLKTAVFEHVRDAGQNVVEDNRESGILAVNGTITLTTPYKLIRTVDYVLGVQAGDGGYKYRIDSIKMTQVERGVETKELRSVEVYKGIEATGPEAVEAEKVLNEIDLRFQKILRLIQNDMKKE